MTKYWSNWGIWKVNKNRKIGKEIKTWRATKMVILSWCFCFFFISLLWDNCNCIWTPLSKSHIIPLSGQKARENATGDLQRVGIILHFLLYKNVLSPAPKPAPLQNYNTEVQKWHRYLKTLEKQPSLYIQEQKREVLLCRA